jgi:hypothetical protein
MAERRKSDGRSKKSDSGGSEPNRSDERESAEDRSPTRGTAPSAADITKLEKFEASDEAKAHEPSAVDAMGEDKRRQVVGHSYGPSKRSQVLFFVLVAVVAVVIIGGWMAAVAAFDTTPEEFPDRAPWTKTASTPDLQSQQQAAPKPVDTPCGEPGNEYPAPSGSPCGPSISTEGKPSASSAGK